MTTNTITHANIIFNTHDITLALQDSTGAHYFLGAEACYSSSLKGEAYLEVAKGLESLLSALNINMPTFLVGMTITHNTDNGTQELFISRGNKTIDAAKLFPVFLASQA